MRDAAGVQKKRTSYAHCDYASEECALGKNVPLRPPLSRSVQRAIVKTTEKTSSRA